MTILERAITAAAYLAYYGTWILRGGQGTSSIQVFRKDATVRVRPSQVKPIIRFSPLHALMENLPIRAIPNFYPQGTFSELFPDRLPIILYDSDMPLFIVSLYSISAILNLHSFRPPTIIVRVGTSIVICSS